MNFLLNSIHTIKYFEVVSVLGSANFRTELELAAAGLRNLKMVGDWGCFGFSHRC